MASTVNVGAAAQLSQMQSEMERLERENQELKRRLAQYEHKFAAITSAPTVNVSNITVSAIAGRKSYHSSMQLTGHKDGIWDVCACRWEPRLLASAGADSRVIVWDLSAGLPILLYSGHKGSVNSVRFHPTLPFILTASGDRTAHISRTLDSSGLPTALNAASAVSDSPGARHHSHVLSNSIPSEAAAHSSAGGAPRRPSVSGTTAIRPVIEVRGHSSAVTTAEWLVRDQLVTCSSSGLARLVAVANGEPQDVFSWQAHENAICNVTAHPTQALFITSSKDGFFKLWDARSVRVATAFDAHSGPLATAIFSPNNGDVVVSSGENNLCVWETRMAKAPLVSVSSSHSGNRVAFSPSGLQFAVPRDDGGTRVYSIKGEVAFDLDTRHVDVIRSLSPSHGVQQAAASLPEPLSTTVDRPLRLMCASAWTADERFIFSGGWACTVFGWKHML